MQRVLDNFAVIVNQQSMLCSCRGLTRSAGVGQFYILRVQSVRTSLVIGVMWFSILLPLQCLSLFYCWCSVFQCSVSFQ